MALFALLLSALSAHAGEPVRGMTVSCPTWGWEWGSDDMVETLDELQALGVNWVSIHPYASIRNNGDVAFRPLDPAAPPDWLQRPIAEAHARGMKVFVKPHIAYWGSKFSWRGDIRFDDDEQRARFFRTYRAWITAIAAVSTGADAFAVGTELDGTVEHADEWRAVITDVRGAYTGPLTYAANWTDYQRVPFWDQLDAIGVQAYFPLVEAGADASDTALDSGWSRVMGDLRALHDRTGKHVVFTELGYPRAADAAVEPWRAVDQPSGGPAQEAALRAALRAIDSEPAVVGAFLWKWFPGRAEPRDFSMERPEVRTIISDRWRAP